VLTLALQTLSPDFSGTVRAGHNTGRSLDTRCSLGERVLVVLNAVSLCLTRTGHYGLPIGHYSTRPGASLTRPGGDPTGTGRCSTRRGGDITPTLDYPTPTLDYPTPTLDYPTPTLDYPTPTLDYPTPKSHCVERSLSALTKSILLTASPPCQPLGVWSCVSWLLLPKPANGGSIYPE